MTYNLGIDSKNHITSVINIIKGEMPDILVLNEAGWLNNEPHTLEGLSARLSLPYFFFAKSTESVNDVALFSRFQLKNAQLVRGLQNAGIVAVVKTEFGNLSIAGVHLASNTEDTRLTEITSVISQQKNCLYKVILGDLNSISPEDIVEDENLQEIPEPRSEVVEYIGKAGYLDAAVITQKQQISTVPMTRDNGVEYHDLRLDYIFLSNSLANQKIDYNVVDNEVSRTCSDHFPIVVRIQ